MASHILPSVYETHNPGLTTRPSDKIVTDANLVYKWLIFPWLTLLRLDYNKRAVRNWIKETHLIFVGSTLTQPLTKDKIYCKMTSTKISKFTSTKLWFYFTLLKYQNLLVGLLVPVRGVYLKFCYWMNCFTLGCIYLSQTLFFTFRHSLFVILKITNIIFTNM